MTATELPAMIDLQLERMDGLLLDPAPGPQFVRALAHGRLIAGHLRAAGISGPDAARDLTGLAIALASTIAEGIDMPPEVVAATRQAPVSLTVDAATAAAVELTNLVALVAALLR